MKNLSEYKNFLIEYFSGIQNDDFYEEPVEVEYPDW